MTKILLVEDDPAVSESIVDLLTWAQFKDIEAVDNGEDALQILSNSNYDLIIVDWGLPGMSGIEFCRKFRQLQRQSPILMLTAKGDFEDKETGLDAGADDYMVKPFNSQELAARVRALLRRVPNYQSDKITIGNLTLDRSAHRIEQNSEALKLMPREYALLEFFMLHPNQVFTFEALLTNVWKFEGEASDQAVRQCVKRLRKRLQPPADAMLKTVFAVGYQFDTEQLQPDEGSLADE